MNLPIYRHGLSLIPMLNYKLQMSNRHSAKLARVDIQLFKGIEIGIFILTDQYIQQISRETAVDKPVDIFTVLRHFYWSPNLPPT
ncbi:hypothetical protein, partial [Rhizobium rhizogenes]